MPQPDISKHLKEIIGGLVLELATAKAVIEQQDAQLKAAETASEPGATSGRGNGAQGADGSRTE